MTFCIESVGTAIPSNSITQDDAARLAIELTADGDGRATTIHALYRRTGVRSRHSTLITSSTNGRPATQSFFPIACDAGDRGPTTRERMHCYENEALDLAANAASTALRNGDTAPEQVDHLVTVSCTGFSAPGVDVGLVEKLGLNRAVSRTHVGFMGCHGALNGMRVASALGGSSPRSKVLLCCVELCTIHHQYAANPQQVVANALFSDGAAAIVGSTSGVADRTWRVADQFSLLLPETADLMGWQIGDNGFVMRLSPQVPNVVRKMLRPWLGEHLSRHGLAIEDVRSWAIHPGGPRILTACGESLGLDAVCLEPSQGVLADYGNMSSPTILFILERLRKQQQSLPCVLLAFGPGLTIEAALIV
jgi:predicted naringenin-chalcone synthase